MPEEKPLPSDEERALEIAGPHLHGAYNLDFTGRECGVPDCSWKKRVQAIVALLAQVRAEASQEKRCHNVRGEDGPCDCAGCRDVDALREENARLRERVRMLEEGLTQIRKWTTDTASREEANHALGDSELAPEKAPAPDLVGELVEALEQTTEHLCAGIHESRADYQSPPEPSSQWDADAVTHVVANRVLLAKHRKGEK